MGELVLVGGAVVVRGLRLFTDADPDNKAQLSALLKDLTKDERTKKAVLLSLLLLVEGGGESILYVSLS